MYICLYFYLRGLENFTFVYIGMYLYPPCPIAVYLSTFLFIFETFELTNCLKRLGFVPQRTSMRLNNAISYRYKGMYRDG